MTIKQQIENARLEIDTWSSEKLTNVQLEGTLHQKSERVLKEHFLWNVDMKIELWFDYDGHTYTPVVDTTGYIQKSAIHVLNTNRKMFLLDKNLNEYYITDGEIILFGELINTVTALDQDFVAFVRIGDKEWRDREPMYPHNCKVTVIEHE